MLWPDLKIIKMGTGLRKSKNKQLYAEIFADVTSRSTYTKRLLNFGSPSGPEFIETLYFLPKFG